METLAFVLILLVLWISGTLTFPLISEEDGPGELCDYSEPESNCGEQNDWGANIVCENDRGGNENVNTNCNTNVNTSDTEFEPDEYIMETRDYINEDQDEEPLDEEQFAAPEEPKGSSLFYKIVSDELEPSVLAGGSISQSIKKFKVKRSSLYDNNLHEEDDESTNGSIESKTVKGDNFQERDPSTNSQNTTPKAETTPKSWFWSWLFKSSQQSTNNSKVVENSPRTESLETAEETINNLDCESDCYDKEKSNTGEGCGGNLTFEKGNTDNFTTQIHKEEAILEQEIMDHNPGITTTESVWNRDEFVDKTSK